jgi:ankyrin repeat protein
MSGYCDIDRQDFNGKTPLYFAVVRGYHRVVKLLLKKGAVSFSHMDYLEYNYPDLSDSGEI